MSVARRSMIKAGVSVASCVAALAPFALARLLAPQAAAASSTALKPPGALVENTAFNAACIGCGLCGEVCPPRCIQFHRRDGGAAANTPYIDPRAKSCTLCGKCMIACPTDALNETALSEINMGIAQIDRDACYPWVDRGICGACVVVCPLGERAISFDFAGMYRPVVERGCVGCGQCVEVCPHPSVPIRIVERRDPRTASLNHATHAADA
jgi:MauM/NapG family ferredoxin protein